MNKINEQVWYDTSIEGVDPASVHQVKLGSGMMMPVAAYGTFHSDWAQDYMKDATVEAIRLGWRHLDTARAYENEDVVGEAIREAIRAVAGDTGFDATILTVGDGLLVARRR